MRLQVLKTQHDYYRAKKALLLNYIITTSIFSKYGFQAVYKVSGLRAVLFYAEEVNSELRLKKV